MESRPGASINLQETESTTHAIRQTRILANQEISNPLRPLSILHGRLRPESRNEPRSLGSGRLGGPPLRWGLAGACVQAGAQEPVRADILAGLDREKLGQTG